MESHGTDRSKEELWCAVTNQDVGAAIRLIENGADVNSSMTDKNQSSRNLLSTVITTLSSSNDRQRIVQQILSAGACVNALDKPGTQQSSTPLIDACREGDEELVRLLLRHGADVNYLVTSSYRTPLMWAAGKNRWKLIELLVSNGAVVNGVAGGINPLYAASANGCVEAVRALLDLGARPDQLGHPKLLGCNETPLCVASANNATTEMIRLLVDRGANVNYCGLRGTPLTCAASCGRYDAVKLLIERGAEVNMKGRKGVFFAVALREVVVRGHENVFRLLLDNQLSLTLSDKINLAGAAVEAKQPRILSTLLSPPLGLPGFALSMLPPLSAVSNDDAETMRLLFEMGVDVVVRDPSNKSCNALFTAVATGKSQIVRLFIDKGFDVNVRDIYGKTLLIAAAAKGSLETVKELVVHGADVYAVDGEGRSALDHARYGRHWETVTYLSQYRKQNKIPVFQCKVEPHDCNTALHEVASAEEAIDLLNNGADVNAENKFGRRPLHFAAVQGLEKLAEVLINNGAVLDARDNWGNTALHLAAAGGLAIMKTLTLHLACPSHLNIQNASGKTALHEAVQHGNYDVAVHLLERGANAELVDIFLSTAFHYVDLQSVVFWSKIGLYLSPDKMSTWTLPNLFGLSFIDRFKQHVAYSRCCDRTLIHSRNQTVTGFKGDILGNTELHSAFGVYSASKVSLPSANPAATCAFLINADNSQLTSQNVYGQTPMHIAHSASEVRTCLQYGNDDLLLIKDRRKRNFWHLLAIRESDPRHIVESIEQQTLDDKFRGLDAVDIFGRTPLHYAVANPRVEWYAKWLTRKAIHCASMHDMYGRPPLHYLTQGSGLDSYIRLQILEASKSGSGVRLPDDALVLAMTSSSDLRSSCFDYQMNDLRKLQASQDLKNIFSANRGIASSRFDSIAECIVKFNLKPIIRIGDCEEDFVWKIWQSCQFMYPSYEVLSSMLTNEFPEMQSINGNNTNEGSLGISEDSQEIAPRNITDQSSQTPKLHARDSFTPMEMATSLLCEMARRFGDADLQRRSVVKIAGNRFKQSSVGAPEGREKSAATNTTDQSSRTPELRMFDSITKLVTSTIKLMAKSVGEIDPKFRCSVKPAGSGYEGTKVNFCDEFDFIVVLEHFSDICTVVNGLNSSEGFVMLKGATGKTAMCEEYFDNDGILNTSQVKFRFEALVKQVLYEPRFQLENDALELVEVLRGENILYSFSVRRLGINIKMKFMRPVNDQLLFHEVSIDIVPAIRIPHYWPTDAVQDLSILFGPYSDRLPDRRCYLVFDQPQRHRPWIPWTPTHARADFSLFESDVIRSSPPVVRAACIVVKQIVRNFCDFTFFKSYAIKAALMHCIADYADELSQADRSSSAAIDKKQLLKWVQRILLRMLCFVVQDFVPSVFLPGFKLPTCWFQTYLKFSHIYLFQHGLTHLDLVNVELFEREKTKQMTDSQFEYIVKSYVISHLMYWSVLPNNAVRHVYHLPIDPVREIDCWKFMQSS